MWSVTPKGRIEVRTEHEGRFKMKVVMHGNTGIVTGVWAGVGTDGGGKAVDGRGTLGRHPVKAKPAGSAWRRRGTPVREVASAPQADSSQRSATIIHRSPGPGAEPDRATTPMISPILVPLAGRSTTKRATWRSPSCQTSSTVPTNTVSMASKPARPAGDRR